MKAYLLIASLIVQQCLIGQTIQSALELDPDCYTVSLELKVDFPFGSGQTCPPLKMVVVQGTFASPLTTTMDVYYDVSGTWPAHFCTATDTIQASVETKSLLVRVITANETGTASTSASTLILMCATVDSPMDQAEQGLRIYPNPARELINIGGTGNEGETDVCIRDATGRIVLVQKSTSDSVDVSRLSSGLYMIAVKTRSEYQTQRLILDR
jgi:hypothetical protein